MKTEPVFDALNDLAQQIATSPNMNDHRQVALAILHVAGAIHRLAATQEKPKSKGGVSFSIADYENQPDTQTQELRKLRHEEQG